MALKLFVWWWLCVVCFMSFTRGNTMHLPTKNNEIDFPIVSVKYSKSIWVPISDSGYLSKNGSSFVITCEAKYPITWRTKGFHNDNINFGVPRNNDTFYFLKLNVPYYRNTSKVGYITSLEISCEAVGQPEVNKAISLFVTGRLVSTLRSYENVVEDSRLIPCYTTDPRKPVNLFQIAPNGTQILVNYAKFNPMEGFFSANSFQGNFTCRQGSFSVNVTALNSTLIDAYYSPIASNISLFKDETIRLICSSHLHSVNLLTQDSIFLNITTVNSSVNYKEVILSIVRDSFLPSPLIIHGNASCIVTTNGKERVLKEWIYTFYEPPIFIPSVNETVGGLVTCSTPNYRSMKKMKINLCSSVMECELRRAFLESAYPISSTSPVFTISGSVHYYTNGLVGCIITEGLERTYQFFLSLDNKEYTNWTEAPLNELIRMDPMPPVLHANVKTQFVCTSLTYTFPYKLQLELELSNGSRYSLENNPAFNYSMKRYRTDFKQVAELDIYLPVKAVAIHCLTLRFNSSSEMITATSRFKTKYLQPATIEDDNITSLIPFYIGDNNPQQLDCLGEGEPQPNYVWLFRTNSGEFQNVSKVFPELTSGTQDSKGYLEFENPTKKYSGEYKCVAENYLGEDEKLFVLEVWDKPLSTWIVAVGIALLAIPVISGIAFTIRAYYKRSHNRLQFMTDEEIKEFVRGIPNNLVKGLVESPEEINQSINQLPYNPELEILMKDIEIDDSEKGQLGAGQFSNVYKGRVKGEIVAVKVTKGGIEKELFKSLLSEVKVIGKLAEDGGNINIVGLIGCCTGKLKENCLYIATEICELGDLLGFLRRHRSSFTQYGAINRAFQPVELSTRDLLAFSTQIANGMEYISSKKVVHGDLAARNVLLTANKIVKISDFGLSRNLYTKYFYEKTTKCPLPMLWMAPEARFYLLFSTKSDVYSYGVTLYEIYTLGKTPTETLSRPEYCTEQMFNELIMTCLASEPHMRPIFSEIREYLEKTMLMVERNDASESEDSDTDTESISSAETVIEASASNRDTPKPNNALDAFNHVYENANVQGAVGTEGTWNLEAWLKEVMAESLTQTNPGYMFDDSPTTP